MSGLVFGCLDLHVRCLALFVFVSGFVVLVSGFVFVVCILVASCTMHTGVLAKQYQRLWWWWGGYPHVIVVAWGNPPRLQSRCEKTHAMRHGIPLGTFHGVLQLICEIC